MFSAPCKHIVWLFTNIYKTPPKYLALLFLEGYYTLFLAMETVKSNIKYSASIHTTILELGASFYIQLVWEDSIWN